METMSTGNNQVIKIKPSLVPFTWKGILVVVLGLLFFAGTFLFQYFLAFLFGFGYMMTLASLALVGLGLFMILIGAVRRSMYTYQLTDSHIIIQKQLLGRNVRRIPFGSISDVEISQSFVGRLAGYGNIVPVTKSGYGLVRGMDPTENIVAEMTNVPNPDKVANMIMSRAALLSKVSVNQ